MPPPMPDPAKRMTANPARPVARYRPGKVVQESSSSDEEESGDDIQKNQPAKLAQSKASSFPTEAHGRHVLTHKAQKEASEDEEGFVTEDEDEGDAAQLTRSAVDLGDDAHRVKLQTTAAATPGTTVAGITATASLPPTNGEESRQSGVISADESEDESDEESEEGEESTSEEEPQRKFQRPTFIRKSARVKAISPSMNPSYNAIPNGITGTLPTLEAVEAEELRRKKMADLMIKDKLERDAAARAAGRKGWDDDDDAAVEEMVDDTDGLDPEAEYAAWKLRELKRLKRDREVIEQREKEIEEVERRKNLTQAEREAEDRLFLEQQKEEREEGRSQAGFLQRYHHKGAFFQDDETAELLRKRDLMGAKFVDEVRNREALPQYMQVRDMTKLGKKGRTRYTDLRGEDTGKWGQGFDQKERKGPKIDLTVDERFRADHVGGLKGPTGANASAVRERGKNVNRPTQAPRALNNGDKSENGDRRSDVYRARRRSSDRGAERGAGARKMSTSPRRRISPSGASPDGSGRYTDRYEDEESRNIRKRSSSRHRERDKRRRVEVS